MKVNEIFYSLQGEGFHTGTPAVFVRMSGCNMACDFCDTDHTDGREMTDDEIVAEVCRHPARHVVVTGGEPLLQLTPALVGQLHAEGRTVQIETNGTLPLRDGLERLVDWVTCSPKYGHIPTIQRIDELKIVFDLDHPEYIIDPATLADRSVSRYSLQPCDRADAAWNAANLRACIAYILDHPLWHLSLQTHKLIGVR